MAEEHLVLTLEGWAAYVKKLETRGRGHHV